MTKAEFLAEYRRTLVRTYSWPNDYPEKLETFITQTAATIRGNVALVGLVNSPAVIETWQTLGGKGRPTLKALRALPD